MKTRYARAIRKGIISARYTPDNPFSADSLSGRAFTRYKTRWEIIADAMTDDEKRLYVVIALGAALSRDPDLRQQLENIERAAIGRARYIGAIR